ncbi:hypothetical protein SHL15_8066 [Streptomyces hygroscopicus subsp. limoneus]|nr:hypothetical protein SHL15_8066 [Streptomyces hygroscopicus subsp. limoneus]
MPLGRPLRSLLEQQRVKRRRSTRFGQGDPACVKPQMRRGGRVVRLRDSVRVWRPDAAHYAQSRLSRQVVPRFPSRERSTTPHDGKDGAAAHVETEHSDCQDTCDRGFLKPHLLPWPKMTEMVSRRCRTQDGHRVDRAGGRAVTGTGGERRYRARSRASGAAWKVGAGAGRWAVSGAPGTASAAGGGTVGAEGLKGLLKALYRAGAGPGHGPGPADGRLGGGRGRARPLASGPLCVEVGDRAGQRLTQGLRQPLDHARHEGRR